MRMKLYELLYKASIVGCISKKWLIDKWLIDLIYLVSNFNVLLINFCTRHTMFLLAAQKIQSLSGALSTLRADRTNNEQRSLFIATAP